MGEQTAMQRRLDCLRGQVAAMRAALELRDVVLHTVAGKCEAEVITAAVAVKDFREHCGDRQPYTSDALEEAHLIGRLCIAVNRMLGDEEPD